MPYGKLFCSSCRIFCSSGSYVMHMTFTNQIVYCMCSEWMSARLPVVRQRSLLIHRKKEQLDAVVDFLGVYISPRWVWKNIVLCLSPISR